MGIEMRGEHVLWDQCPQFQSDVHHLVCLLYHLVSSLHCSSLIICTCACVFCTYCTSNSSIGSYSMSACLHVCMSACGSVCVKWLPWLQTNWRDSGLVLETNCTIVMNTHAILVAKTIKNADSNASFSNITAACSQISDNSFKTSHLRAEQFASIFQGWGTKKGGRVYPKILCVCFLLQYGRTTSNCVLQACPRNLIH